VLGFFSTCLKLCFYFSCNIFFVYLVISLISVCCEGTCKFFTDEGAFLAQGTVTHHDNFASLSTSDTFPNGVTINGVQYYDTNGANPGIGVFDCSPEEGNCLVSYSDGDTMFMDIVHPKPGNGIGFWAAFGRAAETLTVLGKDHHDDTLDTQHLTIPQYPSFTYLGWTCDAETIAQIFVLNNANIVSNLDYIEVTNVSLIERPIACTLGIYYEGIPLTSITVTGNTTAVISPAPPNFVSIPSLNTGDVTISWTPPINGISQVENVDCEGGCFTGVLVGLVTEPTKKRDEFYDVPTTQ